MDVTPVVTSEAFSTIASMDLLRVSSSLGSPTGGLSNLQTMPAPHTCSSDVKMEVMESESSPTALDAHPTVISRVPDSPCWQSSNDSSDALSSSGRVQLTGEKRSDDKCWVCGEKSNTFHYGILSCEGCKSFFARASSNHISYNCPTKQCVINKETRNRCMYCRWKKCVAVGMSKTASKLGRRSKQLKAQIAKHVPNKTAPISTSSDSGLDSPICSPNDGSSHPNTPKQLSSPTLSGYGEFSPLREASSKSSRHSMELNSPTGSVFVPTDTSSTQEDCEPHSRKHKHADDDIQSMPIKSPLSHQSLQWPDVSSVPLPSPTSAWFNVVEDSQLEKFAADIHRIRLESFIFECAHNPKQKVPPAIDMDSVRQGCHMVVKVPTPSLMESMLGCMTDIIRRVVSFCKRIPGFAELPIHDRTSLIKNNMFEMVLVHSSHLVERNELFVVMGDPHLILPMELLKMIPFSGTIVPLFRLNDRIQSLGLSSRETSLLCAMVMLAPDGEDIEHRDTISVLQNRVAQALRREIRSSLRVDPDDTFMQLFIVLPMLREMNVSHRNLVSNFKMKMPGMFSDLHQEVFE
ncbi:probable nuclear hormone receptor HR3 [Lytechinus pictus]|uniref:probable nuclear hormone receptor HR3 n=1 Tax=Lytechinus pictus TaxID=7653 RepID=UPI0030B9FF15